MKLIFAVLCFHLSFIVACDYSAQKTEAPVLRKQSPKQETEVQGEWGHLAGKFVVTGKIPELPDQLIDVDKANLCPDGQPRKDDALVVGANGELKNVFVMMYLKGKDPPAVHPSYEKIKNEPVVQRIVDCRLVPYAIFVRTGQVLRTINEDDVGHNSCPMTFNNERSCNIPPGGEHDWIPEFNDTYPGLMQCDLHFGESGVVLFRDEPYVAISAADGTFRIENIPAGDWKFQFWHERSGNMRQLQVTDYEVGRRGEIEVAITDGETLDLGTMEIAGEHLAE